MPQRFLRPGITTSDNWNAVSWQCQSLYIRILTLVDDYGRFDGRASVLWGQCFSVWNEHNPMLSVGLSDVGEMLQQLAAKNLVDLYMVDGKPVLQVTKWQERIRENIKEKWPIPEGSEKVAASCSKLLLSSPSPSPSPSSPPSPVVPRAAFAAQISMEAVKFQAAKIGLPESEAEKFFHHYESKGWKVGKHKMQSMPSAMAGWKLRWEENRNANNQRNNAGGPRPITGADQRRIGIPEQPRTDDIEELLERRNAAAAKRVAEAPDRP